MKPMKTLCRKVWALAVGVLLTAVCGAAEAWTLDNSAKMPGSFWTITSPDGKWKLACVPNEGNRIDLDGDYSADLVVAREYGWNWTGPTGEPGYDDIDTEDVFGKSVDDGCVVKGSGVLTLPVQARDSSGNSYSVEIGDWALEGWSKPVLRMTKCIVPADYTEGIGEGTSIACGFEVEEGNPKYHSKDGVLYLKGTAREDGGAGDVLWQFPSGKKGTFTIPDGVTKVRSGAFERCGLSELVIGPDLATFESNHEVQKTLRRVTIRGNASFSLVNGLLLGNGGETVVMVLHGVVGRRLVVPSSVTYVAPCSMGYLENVKEMYFTSDELTLDTYALDECENLSVLDFGGVGRLTLNMAALVDVEATTVVFPEDVAFGDGSLYLDDAEIRDIYWPTKKGFSEAGLERAFADDDERVRLHVRKDAGDWNDPGLYGITVVKDLVEPAKPDLPAFLADGEGLRVGVPVSGELTVADYASLKVTGLPPGVKVVFDRKNPGVATFSGAATKEGTYQVAVSYFENGRTVTKIYPLFVDKAPHLAVSVVAGPGGTVRGGGDVYAGKKMTLKATANRGYVFAGWYHDASYTRPYYGYTGSFDDYRNPSLPITNGYAWDEELDLYAKFVPVEEDGAEIFVSNLDDLYETKAEMGAVRISVESLSLPTVKVKGLPPGLKFTTKVIETEDRFYSPNSIYGTPTKSGIYAVTVTATTAGRKTATSNIVFTVANPELNERILKVACDPVGGKVTGAGVYADGRKVTLKATPQKGFAFAGWCDEAGNPLKGAVDYRSPSYSYVVDGDATVRALFARQEEDARWLNLICEEVYYTPGAFNLALEVQSLSLPKVALSGLPPGLKFDAKANRISGTATKPGSYTVTAKLTSASVKKAVEKKFRIIVDNLTGANGYLGVTDAAGGAAALLNGRGEKYVVSVGVKEFDLPVLNAANAGDTVSLSALPSGLKYNAKTGRIEGVATKAGTFTVQAKVKSGRATYVSTFTVEVRALPSWAVGTFVGCGEGEIPGYDALEDNLYGTVTVGATGKVSGKVLFDTGDDRLLTATFSAPALTEWQYDAEGGGYFFDVTLAFKDGRTVVESRSCRFCIEQNNYDGGVEGGMISMVNDRADLTLHQNVWRVKGFENLPVFAEKKTVVSTTQAIHGDTAVEGFSTLTLTIDQKGTVSGTLIDEGTEAGEPFRERVAFKADLIPTRHGTDEDGECYEAEVPIALGNIATIRAVVKMRVSSVDGKVHADGCTITSCTDFADWE